MEYQSPLDKLYHWERFQPEKVFLCQPVNNVWRTWTWRQAAGEVRAMAAALKEMNLPPNSHIALISKNCAHWILCDLAIMMSGHISVPLYPNLNAESIKLILEHSDAELLFVGKLDNWHSMKSGVPDGLHCISFPLYPHEEYENWDDLIVKYAPLREDIQRSPDEIATIVYTSGTSGISKAVMHKYYNFSFTNFHAKSYLGVGNSERFFSYLPLSHIAERILVEIGSIYNGGKVFFAESQDTFQKNLAAAKPTIFLAVHRIWKKFQEGILDKISQDKLDRMLKIPILSGLVKRKIKRGLGLAKATNIFTGAAPTPVSLIKWFEAIGVRIQEAYAMTENCCYSHVTQNGNIKIGYVGRALPACEAKLDMNNEILIRHKALMTGYYKDPIATEDAFTSDGFLRTGDQGFIDEEGFLKIIGRVKDIFKTSKGKYISPSPIELQISGLSDIEFVCIVGSGLPQPMALVTLSESGMKKTRPVLEFTIKKTLVALNSKLNHHEQLTKIVVLKDSWTVDNNLITPSFKVKRGNIELKYEAQFEKWYAQQGVLIWEN